MEMKELLEVLNIELPEDADKDTASELIRKTWIPRELVPEDKELVNTIYGKKIGSLERAQKKRLRGMLEDVGLDANLIEGFKISDTEAEDEKNPLTNISKALKEKVQELAEKANAGGKVDDKALEKLQAQIEAIKKERDEYQGMLTEKDTEFNEFRTTVEQRARENKIRQAQQEAFSKFTLSDSVDDIKKRGFNALFHDKYKIDLDDEGKVVVLNTEDNTRVKNASKTGAASLEEVYKMELEANQMLKKNNAQPPRERSRHQAGTDDLPKGELGRNVTNAQSFADKLRESEAKNKK